MLKQMTKTTFGYCRSFCKWIVLALITGCLGGVVGSLFHIAIDTVTELRVHNGWLIYLLPAGGVVIAFVYKLCHKYGKLDTNRIIRSVQSEESVPFILTPLIFFGAGVTHLLGGSAGREGAALQLGGSIGYRLGKTARLSGEGMHTIVMTGMASVFAALFGTPLTAAFFSIEVSSVGIMHYGALLPTVVAAFTAYYTAGLFGIAPVRFAPVATGSVTPGFLLAVTLLAILCAVVSILFCSAIKGAEHLGKKYLPNVYLRALVGGGLIVLFTLVLSTTDYNGAGMNVIENAIGGSCRREAFILKILFTAVTIAAGFKGGEIVPAFFVGSTFGCMAASLMGINPATGAAVGFVALFCGVVNCPTASIFLAVEIFGGSALPLFAYAVVISYMLSGNYSLYKSQKIVYSKLDELIDKM